MTKAVTSEKPTATKATTTKTKAAAPKAVAKPSVAASNISIMPEQAAVQPEKVAVKKREAFSAEITAERAYLLWEAEGCEHGRHDEYWLRAEQLIKSEVIS